jgi:hypothetical protein
MERFNEERSTDILIKAKNQLRTVREEFEVERAGLNTQIELLRNQKVDLQAGIIFNANSLEIGQLIRDQRTSNAYSIEILKNKYSMY